MVTRLPYLQDNVVSKHTIHCNASCDGVVLLSLQVIEFTAAALLTGSLGNNIKFAAALFTAARRSCPLHRRAGLHQHVPTPGQDLLVTCQI